MGLMSWFLKPLKETKTATVREQALANMRAARERIGDEEIGKMAATLREESMKVKAERARKEILNADKTLVASHLKDMMKED
ncbi:MAG: hypothetical protein JWO78_506 [Micavibrio sp.]|nr:hypothetical protein [Micavibrio sp.]